MLEVSYLTYPTIDPVLISIGPFAVRWYALAYIAGVWLGYLYVSRLNLRRLPSPLLSAKQLEDLMVWAVIGIILGGRIGYVCFYKADYYLSHPADIPAIWKGGMSFHGGMMGVIVAFYTFARRAKIPYLQLMDVIACAAPLGLCFGRLANFINGELVGRVSDVPWAMVFPHAGDVPRHPSQLYQAGLEGLVLFVILAVVAWRTNLLKRAGKMAGLFLILYALFRSFSEHFREPDAQLGFLFAGLTMGQMLCVPMLLAGLYLILRRDKVAL